MLYTATDGRFKCHFTGNPLGAVCNVRDRPVSGRFKQTKCYASKTLKYVSIYCPNARSRLWFILDCFCEAAVQFPPYPFSPFIRSLRPFLLVRKKKRVFSHTSNDAPLLTRAPLTTAPGYRHMVSFPQYVQHTRQCEIDAQRWRCLCETANAQGQRLALRRQLTVCGP